MTDRSSRPGLSVGRLRALLLLGGALSLAVLLAPPSPAQGGPGEQEIGRLFVQTATQGTMKPIKGTPRFKLKLRGLDPQVVWFSDRPARQAGHLPVRGFVRTWASFGFVEDPPNAALTLLRAGDRRDTVVMELGSPRLGRNPSTVRYSARMLDEATGDLSYLESDLDQRVRRHFRAPALFIDDAAGRVVAGCLIAPYANCVDADLRGADLSGADLTGANLNGAILTKANLTGSDLTGADLSRASLIEANLTSANLAEADLTAANLYLANLTETDLSKARLCHTTMRNGSINSRNC